MYCVCIRVLTTSSGLVAIEVAMPDRKPAPMKMLRSRNCSCSHHLLVSLVLLLPSVVARAYDGAARRSVWRRRNGLACS